MHTLSLSEVRTALRAKKFSSVELTTCFLNRIDKFADLNAFITVCRDEALKVAQCSDQKISNGTAGEFEGIPMAIKDLFLVKGVRATAASKILENFIAPYESTVTQKLRDAGAVFIGKTNLDQFAMGSANLTSYFGKVTNPWSTADKKLVPGGSSGGSAAAVSGHLCSAALGTDTGGSIRQPAAFCGIVGLIPTYGRVSRYGIIALSSSLDQAGPMTKTVRDAALILNIISGYDEKDSTSVNEPVPNYEEFVGKSVKGMRVGIPKELHIEGMDADVESSWQKAIDIMREAGAEIIDISLPHSKYSLPTYYIIQPAEASANLARYDGVRYGYRAEGAKSLNEMYEKTRAEGFGDEVKRRILMGTYVLSAGYYDAYYSKALKVRKLICQDFSDAYQKVDAIMLPTTPTSAFAFGEEPADPVTMYLNDVFTITANMASLPAISVPISLDRVGRPCGIQFYGPRFGEGTLLQLAEVIERNADFPALKEMNYLKEAN